MTITEAKKVRKAAAFHQAAILKPGARCASSPCPICAGYATMVMEAAEAGLDRMASCPQWLKEEIAVAHAYRGHGRKAHLAGKDFWLDEEEACDWCGEFPCEFPLGHEGLHFGWDTSEGIEVSCE